MIITSEILQNNKPFLNDMVLVTSISISSHKINEEKKNNLKMWTKPKFQILQLSGIDKWKLKRDLETGVKKNPKAGMVGGAAAEKVAEVEGRGGGDEIKWVRCRLANWWQKWLRHIQSYYHSLLFTLTHNNFSTEKTRVFMFTCAIFFSFFPLFFFLLKILIKKYP